MHTCCLNMQMDPKSEFSKFTTELQVRPDDIDMFQHVHNSKYLDYVLAARYEQMERCYKMPMEEFMKSGFGWVVKSVNMNYRRPLGLGDVFTVTTGIAELNEKGCRAEFSIKLKKTGKISCDGWFDFVLINLQTGRGMRVTEEMIGRYSI